MEEWMREWPLQCMNEIQMWGQGEELLGDLCLVCSSSDGAKRASKAFVKLDVG